MSYKMMGKYLTKTDTLKLQVINDISCLTTYHPKIWGHKNKWKLTHDRKESASIVEEVTEKEVNKEQTRMVKKDEKNQEMERYQEWNKYNRGVWNEGQKWPQ